MRRFPFNKAIPRYLPSISRILTVVLLLLPSTLTWAGAFVFADEVTGVSVVVHPSPYTGSGGVVNVNVCIDPTSANANDMQIAVQNIVNTYNQLQASTGNLQLGGNNNIPTNFLDFESVTLHEVGHCIGMAHPNAASESGFTGAQMNYTKAADGANNVLNISPGPDGIIGSSDDIRGDDVNLHWFQKFVNNPFTINPVVDSTTYSISLADLPSGHTFVANGDRNVGLALGYANTEAVMQQGTGADEAQRTLTPDDVATLRYGMSGVDEIQGSDDDYTINLVYQGITTNNCHINVKIDAIAGLAYCAVNGASISSGHYRITSANIFLGDQYKWFFNDVSNEQDTTPDVFTFINQFNVSLNTQITSNSIKVTGINSAATISVTNGEYSINSQAFTTASGSVNVGDNLRVRHTSSANIATTMTTTLSIGGELGVFSSTTMSADSIPGAFTFIDQNNVQLNSTIVSNNITVSGINAATTISINDGEYSINSGTFTALNGAVNNGDSVRVRHTTAATFATQTNTLLTIGGVSDTFSSLTVSVDTVPDLFAFIDQFGVPQNAKIISNSITVSGVISISEISIVGGEYSLNGGKFASVSGNVSNGDTVVVRHTTSSEFSTITNTILTIGGVSDTFSSTTLALASSGGGASGDSGGNGGGAFGLQWLLCMLGALAVRVYRKVQRAIPR